MPKLPLAAQPGLSSQQAQRPQQSLQVTLRDRLARLLKIPPVLQIEVAVEIIRAKQRQIHFWRRARCRANSRPRGLPPPGPTTAALSG